MSADMYPCGNCGKPTSGKEGYCQRTPECKKAYHAAHYAENKAEIAAQRADYRAKHKEKIAAQQAAYDAKNKEKIAAKNAAYRAKNKEKIAAYGVAYRAEHKDEKKAYQADYRATPEGRAWWAVYNASPEGRAAHCAKTSRRRMKLKRCMNKLDRELSVAYRLAIASDLCFYCGKPGEHVDHYQSLKKFGTDHWWNLVRACAPCNLTKHDMNGDEFLAECKAA